jgi:hypothetical protein
MAGTDDLDLFVKEALARGLPREKISNALLKAGWPAEQTVTALARYADVDFPVPVPRPRLYLSPREAFMYLVQFSTLYTSAYQLGSLLFVLINRAFPDDLLREGSIDYTRQSLRWSISSLMVAFPVFVLTASAISRGVARDPAKRSSQVRKWLTYLTLFIAATVLVGDVTMLIYSVLGGELTVRFLLKTLTVGSIAGAIFGYYLWDLRQDEGEPRQ